jgi:serine/threonine protein kinase
VLTNSNDLLGRALGTCTLQRLIGRGGMGAVYLAQQSRPRRTVAVKVLLPHLIEARPREEFLARFRREADAIAALDHINIMPIYEYGEQGEAAYLVMPYVIGGTLRERLQAQPIPPIQDVVSIIEQVAAGLDSAHALGIIHRDLKPGNILFHADGRVLITDFGLAKMLKDVTERDSGARALTSAGSIIGTPEYLSPEQGTGNPTDYHTDVYSLGVVLYQMLAGRVPFIGTTPVAVAIKHALEEPPPITQFNPALSSGIQAVVMKALAKTPEQRFASAGELARALRLAISNESIPSTWQTPDTKVPLITTIPTTDSPKPLESAVEVTEPDEGFQMAENATIPLIEDQTSSDQHTDDKTPLDAKYASQVPQEETTPEKVASLATVVMQPDVEDDKPEPKAFHQEVELSTLLPETEQPQHAPVLARERPEKMVQQQPIPLPTPIVPPRHSRIQPIWMIVIGGFLTLLIIGGGLAAYLHSLSPAQPVSSTPNSGGTATAITHATETPSSQYPTPTAIPPTPAIPAGALLYSASSPLSACDKQGGHWTETSIPVTCNPDGSKMANKSGRLVVANLDQLPDNQSPWPRQDFIVQVDVTINPNSQGAFGIDFQPNDKSQGYFAYLLDQSGNWAFKHYDTQGNVIDTLVPGQLLSPVPMKLTLDIRIVGTEYHFFVNGRDTQGHAAIGSQYIKKIVGLAVDTNADITFSNLAIYALS